MLWISKCCYGKTCKSWNKATWSDILAMDICIYRVATRQGKVRELFFQGHGLVREFDQMSGKFWKGENVREMSGNFMLAFWKVCCNIIFIKKITWFSNCMLNFLSSCFMKWFLVVLVSYKSHQIWQMAFQAWKNFGSLIIFPQNPRKVQEF